MCAEIRNIIKIDKDLCTGCGQCVLDCAEGAIALVDGKATVISESYCDGLGACLSGCPEKALTIERRKAVPFDEEAAMRHVASRKAQPGQAKSGSTPSGCPGSAAREFSMQGQLAQPSAGSVLRPFFPGLNAAETEHRRFTWPVKLRLVPAFAPFLKGADILLAADCAGAASAGFSSLAKDRVVLIACPKFEDKSDMQQRLRAIFSAAKPASLSVIRMEVPCCRGIVSLCQEVAQAAGGSCPVREIVLGCDGQVRSLAR